MKRSLHIIALILSFALLLVFSQIALHLPGDSGALVEKKYDSWSGVLRAWVCADWSCGGSFVSWLNRCAVQFEKDHPGVYVEFSNVAEQALNDLPQSGLRPPELLFFSPDVFRNPSILDPIPDSAPSILSGSKTLAVCMGAYAWVVNTSLCDTIPDSPVCLPDEPGRSFSLAAEGLAGSTAEFKFVDPGIDLGLTASAPVKATLDAFLNGETPALVISQYELSKLIRLREAGRGPDWRCIPSGSYMYADQLLLGGIVSGSDESAPARNALAHTFLQFLLTDECQQKLAAIGAFPSTRLTIYPAASAYATMEGMLRSLPLTVPALF